MRVTLLGPVEGWSDGTLVNLGTTRQRCVLAALLAGAGRPVTVDVLIERVWADTPPTTARTTLYSYMARIRRVLRGTRAEITRRSGGYQFRAPADTVDLWRWEELRRQAARAGATLRTELLQAALDLWRGRPLDNLDGAWVQQFRETLQQHHVEVLADWAHGMLELGRPAEVAERLAGPGLGGTLRRKTGGGPDAGAAVHRPDHRGVGMLRPQPAAHHQRTGRRAQRSPAPAAPGAAPN